MVSYKDEGSLKTTDPRHKEGDKIVMPQKSKTKSKSSLTDSELSTLREETMEYLEEQRKEHMKDGSM